MTNARKARERRTAAARAADRRRTLIAAGIVVAMTATGVVIALSRSTPRIETRGQVLAKTGEVNDMGLPVVQTPGRATGTASVEGVQVTGADWTLGTVPLMVAVRPSWTLTNTSDRPVEIGEPNAVVREGCCPGPFTGGQMMLRPGRSTSITFELSMHPGMDGWHDMGVYVPVTSSSGDEQTLELGVTGDFTGTYQG
jgi:hypothetical protein